MYHPVTPMGPTIHLPLQICAGSPARAYGGYMHMCVLPTTVALGPLVRTPVRGWRDGTYSGKPAKNGVFCGVKAFSFVKWPFLAILAKIVYSVISPPPLKKFDRTASNSE